MTSASQHTSVRPVAIAPSSPFAREIGWSRQTAASTCSRAPLWLYRDRTTALLRRYCRFAIEVGRLPSLLGREFFRTRVTAYGTTTFEDAVIFVHDVERCLEKVDDVERELIVRIVLQDYTQEEAAQLMGCGYRTVARRFPDALDRVSEIFLERQLLVPLPEAESQCEETCQEKKTAGSFPTLLKQAK